MHLGVDGIVEVNLVLQDLELSQTPEHKFPPLPFYTVQMRAGEAVSAGTVLPFMIHSPKM